MTSKPMLHFVVAVRQISLPMRLVSCLTLFRESKRNELQEILMSGQSSTITFWDQRFDVASVKDESQVNLPNYLGLGLAFFGPVAGKRVLDIGCGLGENAFALARRGAIVTAIDSSSVAIAKINNYAVANQLDVTGIVGNAMEIGSLGTFDFAVGAMILHHLEPFEAFTESLEAALKPGGKAFFFENNAASRLLIWCRQNLTGRFGIPRYGDSEEFPLTPDEVETLRRRFRVIRQIPEMTLVNMLSVYLLGGRGTALCKRLDGFLLKHNLLTRYSYRQVLLLEKAADL